MKKQFLAHAMRNVLVLCAMAFLLCGAGKAPQATPAEPGIAKLTLGTVPISVNLNASDVWYETAWLTTEFPIACTVQEYPGKEIYVNGSKVTAKAPLSLKLDVMNPQTGIEVKVVDTATKAETINYIRTVPAALDLRTEGSPSEAGFYYLTINQYLCKMDSRGNVVFYAYKPGCGDFKPHVLNGKLYYSYLQQLNVREGFDAGNMKCRAVVLNDKFAEIDSISYLSTQQGMKQHFLEQHEFLMLGEHHYVVSAYVVKRVNNIPSEVKGYSPFGARVVAAVFQEIKDGNLVFQWDSTEHPQLYGMSTDSNDYLGEQTIYADYVHLNSIEVDPADGNYIVSLRNTSSILKISKKTGEILWILGGKGDQFGLAAEQKPSAQHFARISSRGTLTVFDNGLILPAGMPNPFVDAYETRVVEYKLDEKNKRLTSFQEYRVPGTCSPIMGSAELLDEQSNTFLIGWGGKRAGTPVFTETNFKDQRHAFEVWNRDGNIVTGGAYRVYKFSK